VAVSVGVVAYDIANDRRRAAIRKVLTEYGLPVQESVFVLALSASEWRDLKGRVLHLANRRQDDIRVWTLCRDCQQRSSVWSGVRREPAQPVEII
jgi:CRISPR-associated endonuclease Cas2